MTLWILLDFAIFNITGHREQNINVIMLKGTQATLKYVRHYYISFCQQSHFVLELNYQTDKW